MMMKNMKMMNMSKQLAKLNELGSTFSFIKPPEDDIRALNYYRDELKDTLERFDAFKDKVNNIIEKGKQQEYLFEFRRMLSGHCIIHGYNITIIQCTNYIKKDMCNFYEQCKLRQKMLELITI
jgi:hypothetical protein